MLLFLSFPDPSMNSASFEYFAMILSFLARARGGRERTVTSPSLMISTKVEEGGEESGEGEGEVEEREEDLEEGEGRGEG